jgi:hypothetical protein
MTGAIRADVSASLPCNDRSLMNVYEGKRFPVASATLSDSAASAVPPAKSPIHVVATPNE